MKMIQIGEGDWINESTIRRVTLKITHPKDRVLEILCVDGIKDVQGLWVGAVMNQLGLHRDHRGGLDASLLRLEANEANKPLDRSETKE